MKPIAEAVRLLRREVGHECPSSGHLGRDAHFLCHARKEDRDGHRAALWEI